jgi:hypothetical protein
VSYIDVTTVDRDVVHVVIAIHVCFKCMFQMFHLFQMNVAGVLFGCCKSRSRCYIYMHVASIYFKYFRCFIYTPSMLVKEVVLDNDTVSKA